jgi:hypothetical protein
VEEQAASELARHMMSVLDPFLGRFTARQAVALAASQCGATLETLAPDSLQAACAQLRPMLRTLLGAATAREVLDAIARPYRGGGGTP